MQSSASDLAHQRAKVKSYLTTTLPECEITSEIIARGHVPPLFVWTRHRMTAFTFSGTDATKSYKAQYLGFKEYYAKNRARLDTLDLAFVFCMAHNAPKLDEFRSAVETDVFFCRKFVVPLTDTPEECLEGLPFLPLLTRGRDAKRPRSATTFMQQCRVPAALSRYLAVPHQKSAEAIVRECIEQGDAWPRALGSDEGTREMAPMEERELERVHLEGISIRSFRAYRKRRDLRLGSRVTVLYGRNGFGKTSVFDAIDFAATGGVGRLGLSRRAPRFKRAVAHLDGRPEDAAVSLRFASGGKHRELRRWVVSPTRASLDDAVCDRKSALMELTGATSERAERIEHLVSLFRATHFFGQEHQELAKGFSRDCTLPPHVVARLLAFEDYANARNKATAVSGIFGERLTGEEQRIRELKSQLNEARGVLSDLEPVADESGMVAAPKTALASLRRQVRRAGLSVADIKEDREFVKSCRAAMELESAEGEARLRRLRLLVQQVRRLPARSEKLATLVEERSRAENEMAAATKARLKAQRAQTDAAERVERLRVRREAEQKRLEAVRWASATLPRYVDLLRREGVSAAASTSASKARDGVWRRLSAAAEKVRRTEAKGAQTAERITRNKETLRELAALADSHKRWHTNRTQIQELERQERLARVRSEEIQQEEKSLLDQLRQKAAEQDGIEGMVATMEAHQAEHSQLLMQLERHLRDGLCPVCGHDHGSRDQLVNRIESERSRDPAGNLRRKLAHLLQEREQVEGRLAEVRHASEKQGREVEGLSQAQAECLSVVARFEETVTRHGIVMDSSDRVAEAIRLRHTRTLAQTRALESRSVQIEEELLVAKREVETLERELKRLEQSVGAATQEMTDLGREVAQIRGDYRNAQVSLDMDKAELERLRTRHIGELQEIESALAEANDEEEASRDATRVHDQLVSELRNALAGIEERIATGRQDVAETHARLEEYGLVVDAEESTVLAHIQEETRKKEHWERLRDLAESAEIAMDSARVAALERRQRRAIQRAEEVLLAAEHDRKSYLSWGAYFGAVKERLTARQNAAIEDFASDYGPMASVVQKRLRSVYGFEGIQTQNYQTTIRVMVKRGNKTLPPTDYFSQSQQRTLLLGLFLTASIAQTWSAFSAILLDDPIAHFDDVNTYAFLDMVGGLTSAGARAPQVILSTCDRTVFHLARNKFRHLGSEATFYSFGGIGPDGPVVEEMPV